MRLCPFPTSFPPFLQLQKHTIANWICRSISGTIILKVWGGSKFVSGASEKFLATTMLKVHFCGPLWGESRQRGLWSWKAHKGKEPLPLWAHSVNEPLYLLRFCVALYTYDVSQKSSPHPKKLFARFSLVENLFNWKFLGYFPNIYLHQFWSTYHICMNRITFTTLQILTVQFSLGLLLNSWIFY